MNFPFRLLFSWCRTCPLTTVTVAGLSAQRGVDAKCIFMFTVMWSSCKLYAPEVRPGLFGCQIALEVYTVRSVVPLMRTPFLRTRDWRSSHSIITIVRGKGYFVKNTRMRHGSSKDDKSGGVVVRPPLIERIQKAFTAALAMRWGSRRVERQLICSVLNRHCARINLQPQGNCFFHPPSSNELQRRFPIDEENHSLH